MAMVIELGDDGPQAAVDAAAPGETVVADPAVDHVLAEPLVVNTPDLTVRGLSLRLADDADENLIEIGADGVALSAFHLDGNRANQYGERQSSGVLVTGARGVTVADGRVENVSRHGLRIVDASDATSLTPGDTVHVDPGPVADVTVRNVRVDRPRRDGCSVEGPDLRRAHVQNVRTFGSSDRGCVEVKDGASDAVVAGCYAEDCVYGVAVQDHGTYPTADVRIAGNAARDCETLVDAQTDHPPQNVAVTGNVGVRLGADGMGGPGGVYLHLIEGLVVANNVLDGVRGPGLRVEDCRDAAVRGNVIRDVEGPGVAVEAADRLAVADNGVTGSADPAIAVRGGDGGGREVRVGDNRCSGGGIAVSGAVDRYLVAGNLLAGPVVDDADGRGLATDNLATD